MNGIAFNWRRAGFLFFGIVIAWLAGAYLGTIYLLLFYTMVFTVVCSIVQVFWTMESIRVYQRFSNQHPVKGEAIEYAVSVSNETFVPSSRVRLFYRLVHPGALISEDGNELYLGFKDQYKRKFTIYCPYRGIYTVGLDFLEIRDLLGLLTIKQPAHYRTFYVLPRVIDIQSPLRGVNSRFSATNAESGREKDYALFKGFKVYRSGESTRHISWKKFISTGQPLLKEYGNTSEPGIRIYLDTRRSPGSEDNFLEIEDCSMEILVSYVKYCIDKSIPVSVRCSGRRDLNFNALSAGNEESFLSFHRNTAEIEFSEDSPSPLNLFLSDISLGGEWGGTVLFITHLNDIDIFEFVERYGGDAELVGCIINRTGFSGLDRDRNRVLMQSLVEKGAHFFCVDSANSIAEDLVQKCM